MHSVIHVASHTCEHWWSGCSPWACYIDINDSCHQRLCGDELDCMILARLDSWSEVTSLVHVFFGASRRQGIEFNPLHPPLLIGCLTTAPVGRHASVYDRTYLSTLSEIANSFAVPIQVVLTNDFDGMTLWHNLYGASRATPGLLSRGEFGAVGVERLLELYDEKRIHTTFFVPSNSALHFPSVVQQMVNDGHELGHHGVNHEDPTQVQYFTTTSSSHSPCAPQECSSPTVHRMLFTVFVNHQRSHNSAIATDFSHAAKM